MKKVFLFLGKGGVGKTTLAGSLAAYFSKYLGRVFVASIDPAHNLFDFFKVTSKLGPVKISDNLILEEIDIDLYLKKFLKETSLKVKKNYHYLQMINLENMFDVLKYSPGMEEYAMFSALEELIDTWKSKVDYIIIDTPPTGLMLKIFFLPKTTLLWIDKLKKLRKRILERRAQLIHIKGKEEFGNLVYEQEKDGVFEELNIQEKKAKKLLNIFSNPQICKKILIVNYDELSIMEGIKIVNELASINVPIDLVVFNKKGMTNSIAYGKKVENILDKLKSFKKVEVPFYKDHITPRNKMIEIAEMFAKELL